MTSATHMSGGEIYWDCLGNNQYRITMVIYRDCAGINVDPSYTLQVTSPCGNTTLVVTTPGGTEVSQLCDIELPNSTCNGGSLPGIQQYIYTGTITLQPCNFWTISYTNIYRNNAIVNLQNPGAQRTYIRATINNAAVPCNDSPQFTNTAIPFVCMGYPITYSFGAYDPEADSLSYQLISAMGLNGNPLAYVAPNTGALPIPGLTLNPATGQVNFTLNLQGNWVVVVQVNHWVNGQIVGTIMRDMQFVAYPCTNDPPNPATGVIQGLTGSAVQTGPRSIQVCESGSFCFNMVISDPNLPNVLEAFSNIQQNLPGSTFTYTGSNPITATVCWTAQAGTSGFFPFIVNVNDGACPIPAFQTYVYSVTVIPGLYGNITTTNENCTGTGDGTATAVVTTGTAPFTYQWNTGATTSSITAGAGAYTVTITDVNGCVSPPLSATITTTGLPNVANAGADLVGCVGSFPVALNGSVTNATGGSWSGGSGTFTGTWPNVGYTPTASEIGTGSVTLTLTTTGNPTCPPASDQVVITIPNSFASATVTPTDATCYGTANGSAVFAPAQPGFTYAWSTTPVQTNPTATGLGAGTYTVTATDSYGCSITLNTTIGPASPMSIASLTATDESCAGLGNGTATVSVTGGTAPYSYTWSTGATGTSITAGAGSYTVSITDANNCAPVNGTIAIVAAAQPNQANAGPDLIGCVGSFPVALGGSVTNATGGSWSGGTGTFSGTWPNVSYAPTAADISAGSVTLTLTTTGNTACAPAADQVVINIPNSFATATVTPTDATCYGTATGSAVFAPAQPGFTYAWSTTPVQTTPTATGLAAGDYTVTATDSYGCSISLSTTIGPVAPLTLASLTATDESCAGLADGTATAVVTGGTAPYTFTWNTGQSAPSIIGGAGTYTVSITDANNCTPINGTIAIVAAAQPNQANAGPDLIGCVGSFPVALNGSVTNATGGSWSGGNGSFSGTWPNVSYAPSPADINAGSVTLTLTTTGNNACAPAVDQVVINIPNSFATATVTPSDATCYGTATGSAAFAPGQPSFTYAWSTTPVQSTATATGLSAGNYTVTATDSYGCSITLNTTIGEPAALTLSDLSTTDESCAGFGNGSATVTVTGGTSPYVYTWSTGADTPTITAGAGSYTVSITDSNGCAPVTGTATIAATGQPNQANAGPDLVGCMNSYPIQVQGSLVNATGATWSGGSGIITGNGASISYQPTAAEVLAGGVTLTMTTTGNTTCPPASDDVFIALSNSFLNAALQANDLSCNSAWDGTIAFTPALPGNSYSWNDPLGQTSPTATGLAAGTYTVLVTDLLGCDTSLTAAITQPDVLAVTTVNTTNVTCNGGNNGSVQVVVNGGTPGYTYAWSGGQTTATIANLVAGSYAVDITDANGCTTSANAMVDQPAPILLQANAPDTVCVNAPVTFTAQGSGGTGNLFYTWAGLGSGSVLTASLTQSQTVVVTATDQNGCTSAPLMLPVYVLDLDLADFSAFGDTTVCPGGVANVGAMVSGYPGTWSLTWTQLGITGTGPFQYPITGNQVLDVVLMDQCGNTRTEQVQLGLQTPPTIQLPPVIAQGCAPLTVQFPNLQLGPGLTYAWNLGNGSTSSSAAPNVNYAAGTYSVTLTVTTPLGCTATSPTAGQVIAFATPTATFTPSMWSTTTDNATIVFDATTTGSVVAYTWSFGDGGTSSSADPTYTYGEAGTYEVELFVIDTNGCTASAYGPITITPVYDITLPTAFTPNSNGSGGGAYDPNALNNDVFYAFVRDVKEFRMRIFNRWGELIFESDDVMRGWDGYYRNQLSPQDVYVVQTWVRFVDDKEVQKLTDLTLFR